MRTSWLILIATLGLAPEFAIAQQLESPAGLTVAAHASEDSTASSSGGPVSSERSSPVEGAPTPLEEQQAEQGVTLAELEEIASSSNPTLVQAAMRVQAAEGNYIQAGLYPNPYVGYRGEEFGNDGTAGMQGAAFGQELVTAGKLKLNRAVAAEEIRQAQWALQAQRLRVVNDVRTAFYDALVAQRTVKLYEQLVTITQEGLKVTEKLLAGKEASRVNVLQSRVEVRSVALQLQNARNQRLAVWRRLAAVIGRPNAALTSLAGNLDEDMPQLKWEDTLAQLLAGSPELAEAQTGVQRAEWAVQRQYAERLPNLQLQASVSHNNENGYDIASAGIGLPLPIFNRNQGNIHRAHAELMAAQQEVDRVQLQLQERLAATFQQYENSRQQTEKYAKEILPDARESLELVRKGYRAGEFNYLTLLTAQRTYFEASLNYIESVRAVHASSVAIEGMLLSGGLNAGAGPDSTILPGAATGAISGG